MSDKCPVVWEGGGTCRVRGRWPDLLASILKLVVVGILVIVYVSGVWFSRSVASTSKMAELIKVVKAAWVVVAEIRQIGTCVSHRQGPVHS